MDNERNKLKVNIENNTMAGEKKFFWKSKKEEIKSHKSNTERYQK